MMSGASAVPALVSTAWLSANLPSVKVVDASWYLPAMKRVGIDEYAERRIPGAVFFDVDATDDTSSLPHMLPTDAFFAKTIGGLGICSDDHVVCYDGKGIFSAARLWWMFRAFGHARTSVLDGGLPAWQRAEQPIETGAPTAPTAAAGSFEARLDAASVCDLAKIRKLVDASLAAKAGGDALPAGAPLIVDARSQARFEGAVAEARPGCRSGHMPGAASLPFDRLLTPEGTMRPDAELRSVLAEAGVAEPLSMPLVGSCGSGVTASVIALALAHLGREGLVEIYDGSWAEYGADEDQPLATGPA